MGYSQAMKAGYWVQQRGEILGPFNRDELQQMVAARKLRPHDKVSADQKNWVVASRVAGLMTLQRPIGDVTPEDEAKGFRAVPVEEVATDEAEEYQLTPAAEPAPEIVAVQNKPPEPTMSPGAQEILHIAQRSLGAALGGAMGAILFISSLLLAAFVDMATGETMGRTLLLIPLAAVLISATIVVVAIAGTFDTFKLEAQKGGVALVSLQRRFAYIPWSGLETPVGPRDRLEVEVGTTLSFFDNVSGQDMIHMVVLVFILFSGCMPGILFWMMWSRGGEGGKCTGCGCKFARGSTLGRCLCIKSGWKITTRRGMVSRR